MVYLPSFSHIKVRYFQDYVALRKFNCSTTQQPNTSSITLVQFSLRKNIKKLNFPATRFSFIPVIVFLLKNNELVLFHLWETSNDMEFCLLLLLESCTNIFYLGDEKILKIFIHLNASI